MIEELDGSPSGTLAFRFTGHVTGDDYEKVLVPAIDKAIEEHERIKLLAQIGPGFDGYRLDAAWDDTKLGLRHWRGFERIAVVTDVGWIRSSAKALGFMVPCPVQLFELGEIDDAKRWLSESLGSIHLSIDGPLLTIGLLGRLEPSAYEGVNEEVDNLMSRTDPVHLLLDLREFDGWAGLAALGDHLSLVREHYRIPKRIAVVGEKTWHRLAQRVMSRFVNAEARYFTSAEYDSAVAWAAG
jgi:hypothetical protein